MAACGRALAADPGAAGERLACLADIRRLCRSAAPGLTSKMACLRSQPAGKLTAGCRERLAGTEDQGGKAAEEPASRTVKAERFKERLAAACGPDFVKFCKGRDKVVECLAPHREELSERCVSFVKRVRAARASQ